MARRSDGSVVAWGHNPTGQCNVPALPAGLTYVEVAAGGWHTVARRSDGSVVAWGDNAYGQCNVPALPAGLTYVEVAAGGYHTVARRSDGSVVAWGDNDYGQCNVPALPAGLTYVEIAAGAHPHGGAPERRLRRRVGGQRLARPVQRAGAAGGLTYVEIAAGVRAHGGAAQRRLRRRVGRQRLRPVQRSGASGRAHLRRGRARARCPHGGAPSDGSVVAWGCERLRPVQRPAAPGGTHLRRDRGGVRPHGGAPERRRGRLGGDNAYGQCNVPAIPAGLTCVEVAAQHDTVGRYDVAASVVSVGTGCGGAGTPSLAYDVPKLGATVTFALTNGTPSTSGAQLSSLVPAAPTFFGGCFIQVDPLAASLLFPVTTDALGSWSVSFIVSNDPTLVGQRFVTQILLYGTNGPHGIDLTNGLIVMAGY